MALIENELEALRIKIDALPAAHEKLTLAGSLVFDAKAALNEARGEIHHAETAKRYD